MAAAAAEICNSNWNLATEVSPEAERQADAELASFMGSIVLSRAVETRQEANSDSTLREAILQASRGDIQSRRVVRHNVAADVAERLYKAGHQTEVNLKMINGKLTQEGRAVTDIHRNTFEHTVLIPEMHYRAASELKNVLLFEKLSPTGLLDSNDMYVFSTSSTAMTRKQKDEYHLFADTETCSIQRLSKGGENVSLQTAFVAGKATPTSERHDIAAIQKLAQTEGITLTTTDGSEMLRHVFLVPKTENPHGVTDMVRRYDMAAGGTFYGESKPQQDYELYARDCLEREKEFDHLVERITGQLIQEAGAFDSPLEAILRLDELSERLCVGHAVEHKEINARIFGPTAAMHIEEARFFMDQGETERARSSLLLAKQTANSGSCPLFKGSPLETSSSDDNNDSQKESSSKKWMKCPHCDAKVFADPCASMLSCWDCHAKVINGVTYKGNGGSKARAAKEKTTTEAKPLTEIAANKNEIDSDGEAQVAYKKQPQPSFVGV
jgi:hypothetical protein